MAAPAIGIRKMTVQYQRPPYALLGLAGRYSSYLGQPISKKVSPYEQMYDASMPDPMGHYLGVGAAAAELIINALVLANKNDVGSLLDLPCGAGRVTRHLQPLFPEASLYVSDLNKNAEAFAAEEFGATRFDAAENFETPAAQTFDLIFVG